MKRILSQVWGDYEDEKFGYLELGETVSRGEENET